jgi:hypothetical protein
LKNPPGKGGKGGVEIDQDKTMFVKFIVNVLNKFWGKTTPVVQNIHVLD